MLVYYGLVVIITIGLLIYWYDSAYNSNDDAFGDNSSFNLKFNSEFKTDEEIKAIDGFD